MPDPTITDTAVEAFRAGWLPITDMDEFITDETIRAGLAAAYPHLAATALRTYADQLEAETRNAWRNGPNYEGLAAPTFIRLLRKAADVLAAGPGSAPRAPRTDALSVDELAGIATDVARQAIRRAAASPGPYRVGNHQPRNLYRDQTYIGVMFDPADTARIANVLNAATKPATTGTAGRTCTCWPPPNGRDAYIRSLQADRTEIEA